MTSTAKRAALVLFFGFFARCDQSLNPKGIYEERLVVYSILTAERDTQFVRLYRTYDPPGYDPGAVTTDNAVTNAVVSITGAPAFRDTSLPRPDTSRYSTKIRAYVSHPFTVAPGATYSLDVLTPAQEKATAAATVPGNASVLISTPFVLDDPRVFTDDIGIYLTLSPITHGYIVRILFQFEITVGGTVETRYEEIPQSIQTVDNVVYPFYPKLTRRFSGQRIGAQEFVSFSKTAYVHAESSVRVKYQSQQLKFKGVLVVVTQVEPNLYKYYNIANGFQDENSIRTDQPDFTNIQGGIGVFGAMTHDSLFHVLPTDF
ncbi:MAG: DUF4249 family protein [Ignavibacteriales bacterium]|nr:DUF4249 family protein [Ignavibacteriales bacterium]